MTVTQIDSIRFDIGNAIPKEIKFADKKEHKAVQKLSKELYYLSIATIPYGATVFLDQQYLGTAPISKKVKKGRYEVEIKKEGYQSLQENLYVYNYGQDLSFELEKIKTDTTPPAIKIIYPDIRAGMPKTKNRTERIEGVVKDESRIEWLKIGGKKVPVGQDGRFKYLATLKEGKNTFDIKSSDEHGNVGGKPVHFVYERPRPKKEKLTKSIPKIEAQPIKRDTRPPEIVIHSHHISKENMVSQNTKRVTVRGEARDKNGIVEVIVNNKEAIVDKKGNFSADIYLALGNNPIVVTAMDRFENRSSKTFYITRQSSEAVHSSVESKIEHSLKGWYKKQYAVVIGIDRYKDLGIDVLANAVNDAKAVARMFLKMGFDVTELYNTSATKREILRTFSKTIKSVKKSDSFVFYYAGHGQGFTLERGDRVVYIIPYDAAISLVQKDIIEYDYETIPLNTIKKYVKDMKAKHVALLFDSCFAGLAMKRSFSTITKMDSEYYQDLLSRRAMNILTAGDDQPVSDGTGHSPFTRAVLNGLDKRGIDVHDRDGFATFSQLALYVKEKVERATGRRQRPQFDNLGMEDGDFIFKIQ